MNIWLVSFFENTPLDDNQNTRFNSIVKEAVQRDHKVTYWSSTFRHNIKKRRFSETTQKQLDENIEVVFVKTKSYQKNISIGRLWSHYLLSKKLINEFNKRNEEPDIVFIAFPPISTTQSVVNWCKVKNMPVIADIIDPWPTVFEAHFKNYKSFIKLALKPLYYKARNGLSKVSGISAISSEYIEWSKQFNSSVPSQYFYPAIDFDTVQTQLAGIEATENNNFTIIYAGSLGYSYDIPTILAAAEVLEEKYSDSVRFVIAGDGPQRNLVEKYTSGHNNLEYLGRIPKEELIKQYKKANLGLTQHIAGATQSVTYKLFDLLSCGLPVLNSLESEMKNIILDNKVGLHNEPGDYIHLSENIEFYFRNNKEYVDACKRAVVLTKEKGNATVVYGKLLDFIEETADAK